MMLERQREGIAKAKANGKYKGRKATARAKAAVVRELHEKGLDASEIARQAGVGRASVYRILGHLLRCATLDNAVHPSVLSAEAEVSASL
jgi:DNA invertase Pin-like site-specific DNA recombinase